MAPLARKAAPVALLQARTRRWARTEAGRAVAANHARVNVPDDRFKWLCEVYKPKSEVPAFLEIVDIAGLVKCGPAARSR